MNSNIEQGILINRQHMYDVRNNIAEKESFESQIKKLGFKDLEEFFKEKAEYEMQSFLKNNVYSVKPKEAMIKLRELISDKKYGIISVYTDETCVHHGQNKDKIINVEYCKNNNIPIYEYDSFGGSIVATEGDYSMALLIPNSIDIWTSSILNKIKDILLKYFNNVEIQNNDILINKKKVMGSTSLIKDNYFFFIYHFSMSEKNDLIHAICGDPTSEKVPGYIDNKVLSTSELMEELLIWLQGR